MCNVCVCVCVCVSDENKANFQGNTALILAAKNGSAETIKLLVRAGAGAYEGGVGAVLCCATWWIVVGSVYHFI